MKSKAEGPLPSELNPPHKRSPQIERHPNTMKTPDIHSAINTDKVDNCSIASLVDTDPALSDLFCLVAPLIQA